MLLVQGGIYSGEIDGKDAGLMQLRDIALRGKDELLDGADLLGVQDGTGPGGGSTLAKRAAGLTGSHAFVIWRTGHAAVRPTR